MLHLISDHLAKLRKEYRKSRLNEQDFPSDPMPVCRTWLQAAIDQQLPEPHAMLLSTVSATGQPRSRTVLLKDLNTTGFTFFTHYESAKAKDLHANPKVALLFFWIALERQLRIEGQAERLSAAESDAYFATRPRGAQLSAWASLQSSPLPHKQALEEARKKYKKRFLGQKSLPRPPAWGGYLVRPQLIEFWQGRAHRLHDRIAYHKQKEGSWTQTWLSP